jgi:hypothetical protein
VTLLIGNDILTEHNGQLNYDPTKIITTAEPIAQHAKRQIISDEVDSMLNDKVIRPNHSPWSSLVLNKKKMDGSSRFCMDYRVLNHVTKKDVYPLPYIQTIF